MLNSKLGYGEYFALVAACVFGGVVFVGGIGFFAANVIATICGFSPAASAAMISSFTVSGGMAGIPVGLVAFSAMISRFQR